MDLTDGGGPAPVVRRFTVTGPPERAFTAFTAGIGAWWSPAAAAGGQGRTGRLA